MGRTCGGGFPLIFVVLWLLLFDSLGFNVAMPENSDTFFPENIGVSLIERERNVFLPFVELPVYKGSYVQLRCVGVDVKVWFVVMQRVDLVGSLGYVFVSIEDASSSNP